MYSEKEKQLDPQLKSRLYDKINPSLEGFEIYNPDRYKLDKSILEKISREAKS